jgi:hypothetical protein
MTPFMLAVQSLLDGAPAPVPATEPSVEESIAHAADTQVIIRSLAEQLVSEANAVLAAEDRAITLVDETGTGALAFTLGFGDRSARVQTLVSGHTGFAQLLVGDRPEPVPRRLTTDDELQALVLSLISTRPSAQA